MHQHSVRFWARLAVAGLVSGVAIGVTSQSAGAAGPGTMTLFYAAPNAGGTTISLAGLFQGAPNTVYDGSPGHPNIALLNGCGEAPFTGDPNINVTTDANGVAYFTDTIPSGSIQVLSAATSDFNNFSNCYPVGPDNTGWSHAVSIALLGGAGSAPGTIALPGESRWYKFHVTPDSTATITLSGLANDYAVAVYNDIAQANTNVSGGTQSLNKLSAEFASDSFSPSAFVPSAFVPSAFVPSAFVPSAFVPSAFVPSAFVPSSYSPSAFVPSAFVPSAFVPSAFVPSAFVPSAFVPSAFVPSAFVPSAFVPSTYSSAVNRSLLAYNDEGGISNKTVTVNTWQSSGDFYVRVAGRNGANDYNNTFQVSVNDGSGVCSPSVVAIGSAPPAVAASGRHTVILTDLSRVPGAANDIADLQAQLQTLAARPEVTGAVVDLGGDSRVKALNTQADANPTCPFAKNLVASAVKDIVRSYRANNPLAYVVIAGSDAVVPFFRHADQTLLGNETGYKPPVADTSASQASLRLGYTLSDNDYGASTTISLKGTPFPVPDLAVGRLVESASEISGQVQAYLGTNGGVLPTPATSLVTGYDFLTYPANAVKDELAAGTGHAPDTLIAPRTLPSSDPASWTGTDLRNKVLNSGRHDIVFLAGHFSANDALAADYTTDMVTTDMEQSGVDLTNSLVFSAGCHSGYNIVNGDAVPNVTLTLDWPQEFARKRAILIGGTGYQYGDTDFIAYSEQIYTDFAHQLRLGTGAVSIGQALLRAKQDYLTNTPVLGAINQKATLEASLYGLPMASINMPFGRISAPADVSIVSATTAATTNPGSTLGLRSANVTVTPTLTTNSVSLTNVNDLSAVTATYLAGTNGIVTNPYQPVLPLESRNVSVAGQALRGALFLGGTYTDTPDVIPLTGAPATQISGLHTGFQSSVFFPERPWSVNQLDAIDGNGTSATRLMVTPAQHRSDLPPGSTTDTRRQFSSMSFQLFYSANSTTYGSGSTASTPALASAPDIVHVQSQLDNTPGLVDVCITVGGNPAAGVQDTVVTWSDASASPGTWQSQDLSQSGCDPSYFWDASPGDSTSWGGKINLNSTTPANLRFMVQAVNGVGLVTMDDHFGKYYTVPLTGFQPSFINNFQVGATTATYGSSVSASATVTDLFGNAVAGEPVAFTIGPQTMTAITGADGTASTTLVLAVPLGTYTPSAAVVSTDGYYPSSAQAAQTITVTPRPTALQLAPTPGPLPTGDTGFTAVLCATSAVTCSSTDPSVSDRPIVFVLAGPINRTLATQTNSAGQARFDGYGLPPGNYTLTAYFAGVIPGVGTVSDPEYAPASASVAITTTTPYTSPPVLTVPANITVNTTSAKGAVVYYVASATDPVDPRPQVSCSPGPVTLFAIGTTTVSCTATDAAGNSAVKSFTVTVLGQTLPLSPGTTICNGTYKGAGTDVVVPSGASCRLLPGTFVFHNITVQAGGTLNTQGVVVGHDVTLSGARPSTLCALLVFGNLSVLNGPASTTPTVIGDTSNGCSAGAFVSGNVTISGNAGPVDLGSSVIGIFTGAGAGNVVATNNTGAVTVRGNRVARDLVVSFNTAPVTVIGNHVGHNLLVQGDKPGGATVSTNVAGHDATCSSDNPLTGTGNVASHTSTCPV